MSDDPDDLEDARSRNENRKYVEDRRRTMVVRGRWLRVHPFRASPAETLMAWLGAAILLVIALAFLLNAWHRGGTWRLGAD